jgi:dTDP-4-dehydrorhamnose 3,5-epimerase-like enzyme
MSLIHHKVLGDHRGELVAVEGNRDIPFDIKRVFYIYDVKKNSVRGQHSHYKTMQYIIAVSGSCKVTLDDGETKKIFDLNKPNKGLFQDALIWGKMHDFSDDCVLVVFANEYYKPEDYIINYNQFLEVVNGKL